MSFSEDLADLIRQWGDAQSKVRMCEARAFLLDYDLAVLDDGGQVAA